MPKVKWPITRPHFRKVKGHWVVCGPAASVRIGPVTVSKKSGETSEVTVTSVGQEFKDSAGTVCVYGYLAGKEPRPTGPDRGPLYHQPVEFEGDDFGPCDECKSAPAVRRATDRKGKKGFVCIACARGPRGELEF